MVSLVLSYLICIFEFETLYTAIAELKAGACVTLCNQVPVMWPDFNEIGHATAFYGSCKRFTR